MIERMKQPYIKYIESYCRHYLLVNIADVNKSNLKTVEFSSKEANKHKNN